MLKKSSVLNTIQGRHCTKYNIKETSANRKIYKCNRNKSITQKNLQLQRIMHNIAVLSFCDKFKQTLLTLSVKTEGPLVQPFAVHCCEVLRSRGQVH